jgi:hypothetical protein
MQFTVQLLARLNNIRLSVPSSPLHISVPSSPLRLSVPSSPLRLTYCPVLSYAGTLRSSSTLSVCSTSFALARYATSWLCRARMRVVAAHTKKERVCECCMQLCNGQTIRMQLDSARLFRTDSDEPMPVSLNQIPTNRCPDLAMFGLGSNVFAFSPIYCASSSHQLTHLSNTPHVMMDANSRCCLWLWTASPRAQR